MVKKRIGARQNRVSNKISISVNSRKIEQCLNAQRCLYVWVHFKVSFLFRRENTRLTSRAARPIARLKDAVGQEDHSSGESPDPTVLVEGWDSRQMRHSEIHLYKSKRASKACAWL
jgi:hypothetical protein